MIYLIIIGAVFVIGVLVKGIINYIEYLKNEKLFK